ncbi:MAG: polyketide synthase dehydratase domain-containing protein [Anaerolineales bacterium]|nr:polyketide synthase dehydratase domain-containing protein [Anaerolineales bacterium]
MEPIERLHGTLPANKGTDIAIIGMACLFPGAPDVETYWNNIIHKVDAITDPPPEAWDPDLYYDPEDKERLYCKKGGFLGPWTHFNPFDYGIMPRGIEGGDPDQWLTLKVAMTALEDAGYLQSLQENEVERHRTAVILGKGTYLNRGNMNMLQHSMVVDQTLRILHTLHPEYTVDDLQTIREHLKTQLPAFDSESAPGLVPNIIASRIANRLDLMGPTYTVDAACASSLIAVDIAVTELATGQADLALAGGSHVTTPVPILSLFSHLNALSRAEIIRPFDANADGTILGEGIGIVVLKRLTDAQRDGDRIYAVIKGVGTSSDGRAKGVLAPRPEGARLAVTRAYEKAGIDSTTVGLIEAHGTATTAGDASEITALQPLLPAIEGRPPYCAIGSVKSMIGHTMASAGVAGVIKTALALYHKVLPPTLNVEEPNPKLPLAQTGLYINTETRPWVQRGSTPRRAGVNAFGFGGINAHVVMEEYPVPEYAPEEGFMRHWDSELVILEAEDRTGLIEAAAELQAYLASDVNVPLADLGYTINSRLSDKPARLAIVADSLTDLQEKLARAQEQLLKPNRKRIRDTNGGLYYFEERAYPQGKLAFLFPGEGSQYPNMLADLCEHFPEVRACYDRIDRMYNDHPRGYVPSDVIFPRPLGRGELGEKLWDIDEAIEAVLTGNQALFTLLNQLGIKPDVIAGHSTGEYSAMRAAGMIQMDDEAFFRSLLDVSRRYDHVATEKQVPSYALAAVGTGREKVQDILDAVDGDLHIGMDNCPHQTVIAGSRADIDKAIILMREKGMIYELLPFDRAYHTPLFAAFEETLRDFFQRLPMAPAQTPTYSGTTARLFSDDLNEIRDTAVEHWVATVRFRELVQQMHDDGVRLFVEVGGRGNLNAFINDILRGQTQYAIPVNLQQRSGIKQLNHLLAQLAAHGVPMDLRYLYQRRRPRLLTLTKGEDVTQVSAGTMKLQTSWAMMELHPEVAAKVRRVAAVPASAEKSPAAGPSNGHARAATPPEALPKLAASAPVPAKAGPAPAPPIIAPPAVAPVVAAPPPMAAPPVPAPPPTYTPAAPPVYTPAAPPNMVDPRAQVMQAHLGLMQQFLQAQEAVMQQVIARAQGASAPPAAAPAPPTYAPPPLPMPPTVPMPATITPPLPRIAAPGVSAMMPPAPPTVAAPAALPQAQPTVPAPPQTPAAALVTPPEPTSWSAEKITGSLLHLVSERTGYPPELLNLTADLEADLGIDSIKRVEILNAFNEETGLIKPDLMDRVSALRTLQEMVNVMAENAPSGAAPVLTSQTLPDYPFVREIESITPGQELVAICKLDLQKDTFLHHHTLGRDVSVTDKSLIGLPVVPFTVSMEILAETAATLMPDQLLVGMKEVRGYRWVIVENETLTLRLVAKRKKGTTNEVDVRLHLADGEPGSNIKMPLIEGTMVFGTAYPPAPTPQSLTLTNEHPSRWHPGNIYAEGLFHGADFRAIAGVTRTGDDGLEATLQALPRDHHFQDRDPNFITDPAILDAAGQVVGLWTMENLEEGFIIFPYRLGEIRFYRPPIRHPEQASFRARVNLTNDGRTYSDIDIVDPQGQMWMQLLSWEDKRFYGLTWHFYRFELNPPAAMLSLPWETAQAGLGENGVAVRVPEFPEGFFDASFGLWGKVLANLSLNRREREVWRGMNVPAKRRIEWLLGRTAAKDAVRHLLKQKYGIILCPADIEIGQDENRRPLALGDWRSQIDAPIEISITHSNGVAAAAASQRGGVGIDMEPETRSVAEFANAAFAPAEQALLAELGQPDAARWDLRLWCAKEAAGKAIGQGMAHGPLSFIARRMDAQSGIIELGVSERMGQEFPELRDRTLTTVTVQDQGFIIATAVN